MKPTEEIKELIKIANLANHQVFIPDFAEEFTKRFVEKTGRPFGKLDKDYWDILGGLWSEMERDFPKVAEYANEGYKTALRFYFQEIHQSSPTRLVNESAMLAYKVQNFVRTKRIRNNMRIIAYEQRAKLGNYSVEATEDKPPVFLPPEAYTGWQDETYDIFGSRVFSLVDEDEQGRGVPVVSPMVNILKGIELRRFKTCLICYKIFWATRTDARFCSENCGATARQRAYYYRNKK